MNQKQFSFQSQNLVVDWISFKFQNLSLQTETRIITHLSSLGFNFYQKSAKYRKPLIQKLKVNAENTLEARFLTDTPHWQGTILEFSGSNAQNFYNLIKQGSVSMEIFHTATLGRLDINFSQKNSNNKHEKVKMEPVDFLDLCHKELLKTHKNVILQKNNQGIILRIGSRRSNQYCRIYLENKNSSLKFEYEIKGQFLQKYSSLLFLKDFAEFESQVSKQFLLHFAKSLPLEYCDKCSYLDWLIIRLRPIRKQNHFKFGLNSDYINSKLIIDPRTLVKFIQFLNYAQNLDYQLRNWDGVIYRKVTFSVRDFLVFQNPTISSTNRYQFQQTKEFFKDLVTRSVINSFTNAQFQTLVTIPRVEYELCSKQKYLLANVWLVNDLFSYSYPFYFPNLFQKKLSKDEFQVRFQFLQVFTSINLEKQFILRELFSFSSRISNQRKANIKRYLIELVNYLKDKDLIESKYKIISKEGQIYTTSKLTTTNISEGFYIYEKLNI